MNHILKGAPVDFRKKGHPVGTQIVQVARPTMQPLIAGLIFAVADAEIEHRVFRYPPRQEEEPE